MATDSIVLHILKIAVFLLSGINLWPYWQLIAASIVLGMAGTWFGKHVLDHFIPDAWFEWMFKGIITVLALNLLWGFAVSVVG